MQALIAWSCCYVYQRAFSQASCKIFVLLRLCRGADRHVPATWMIPQSEVPFVLPGDGVARTEL